MSNKQFSWGQRASLEILWILCRLFGMIPFWIQYHVISPVIYFIVYKVIRYREKVVDENLSSVFTNKSEAQRLEIKRGFYRTLSDLIVSTIALSSPKIGKRFDKFDDTECNAGRHREETKGRNWIGLTAHFGLWEHFVFWGDFSQTYSVGAYHKLKNPVMNELFIRIRTRNHKYAMVVESKQTLRFCIRNKGLINGRNYALGLIADQSATIYADSVEYDFLGRKTVFFDGGEKLALKMKFPVYFTYQRQVGRGKYRFACDMIYDGEESVEPNEITRRYVKRLEEEIRLNPHMWLWSHRRWKKGGKRKVRVTG